MSRTRFWLAVAGASLIALLPVLILHATSTRLLASWHGFLHTAIANRFPSPIIPPENPFFAGESLPYYWFYHFVGSAISRAFTIDPLHTFQLMTLAALIGVIVFGALIGRAHLRSVGAGLLIAYLALAGANPAGPLIAVAKHLLWGAPLFDPVTGPVESVFVSNAMADGWMTHPLLGALYLSADWRVGQNLVWFLDISARGPALACLMALLYAFQLAQRQRLAGFAVLLLAALTTALNPVIGLAAIGCLCLASLLAAAERNGPNGLSALVSARVLLPILAASAGVMLALPAYRHLFGYGEGTTSMAAVSDFPRRIVMVALTYGPTVILAVLGARSCSAASRGVVRTMTGAGLLLLIGLTFGRLEDGNEHNLANAAACVLALPAAAWAYGAAAAQGRNRRWLIWLLFLPATAASLVAYTGRPDLPLVIENGTLQREPAASPLNQLYAWIREDTPRTAIFVVDPADPVKLSGNVSELPAFTGRTLFTDQPTYLTAPYPDAQLRLDVAARALRGEPLHPDAQAYLRRFNRPVYLINYRGDHARFEREYGKAVFQADWVAVFEVVRF